MEKKKKRKVNILTRRQVADRRKKVLRLRMAGLSSSQILRELHEDPVFEKVKEKTIWHDIAWLKKKGKIEKVVDEVVVKEAYQQARNNLDLLIRESNWRFKILSDRLREAEGRLVEEREEIARRRETEPQQAPDTDLLDAVESEAKELHARLQKEQRSLLNIVDRKTELPHKLGYVAEKKSIAVQEEQDSLIAKINAIEDKSLRKQYIDALKFLSTLNN